MLRSAMCQRPRLRCDRARSCVRLTAQPAAKRCATMLEAPSTPSRPVRLPPALTTPKAELAPPRVSSGQSHVSSEVRRSLCATKIRCCSSKLDLTQRPGPAHRAAFPAVGHNTRADTAASADVTARSTVDTAHERPAVRLARSPTSDRRHARAAADIGALSPARRRRRAWTHRRVRSIA